MPPRRSQTLTTSVLRLSVESSWRAVETPGGRCRCHVLGIRVSHPRVGVVVVRASLSLRRCRSEDAACAVAPDEHTLKVGCELKWVTIDADSDHSDPKSVLALLDRCCGGGGGKKWQFMRAVRICAGWPSRRRALPCGA
jgi:hypothetical protein